MAIKIIAIGNRIMEDDAIGIIVAENLRDIFVKQHIQTIICETDIDYYIDSIDIEDTLFILDASNFGYEPGTVTFIPLTEFKFCNSYFSLHEINLIKLLELCNKHMCGYIIGIEVNEIKYGSYLSESLQYKLKDICKRVEIIIQNSL